MESMFEALLQANEPVSAIAALDSLAQHYRKHGDFHRLFEVRKYQARIRAGQPVFQDRHHRARDDAPLQALEKDLLEACREVGQALASAGQPGAAWTYLQPLDDPNFVQDVVTKIPVSSDTISEIIQVALFEQAHPVYGFQLTLEHLGTCQAISAFDAVSPALGPVERAELAEQLIGHLVQEVTRNILSSLGTSAAASVASPADRLAELLADPTSALLASVPHIDATHLVSAMRIGRNVRTIEAYRQAACLASYGRRLPEILQYSSDPPFEATYLDHEFYFSALADREAIEAALEHFRAKSEQASDPQSQLAAREIVVHLLGRQGDWQAALREALRSGPDFGAWGLAANRIEIALQAADPQPALDQLQRESDLLGFAALALSRSQNRP